MFGAGRARKEGAPTRAAGGMKSGIGIKGFGGGNGPFTTDLGDLVASSGMVGRKQADIVKSGSWQSGRGSARGSPRRQPPPGPIGTSGLKTPRRSNHQGLADLAFFDVRLVLEKELRRGGGFGRLQALVRVRDGRRWPSAEFGAGLKMLNVFDSGDELASSWGGLVPPGGGKRGSDGASGQLSLGIGPGLGTSQPASVAGASPFLSHGGFPAKQRVGPGVRSALQRGGMSGPGGGLLRSGDEATLPSSMRRALKPAASGPPSPDRGAVPALDLGGVNNGRRSPDPTSRAVSPPANTASPRPFGPIGASARGGGWSVTILEGNLSHAGAGIV